MVSRSVPAKRKQAADMVESPPKRVTRARKAAATEETEVKPKPTKAVPAKTAATKKKSASAAPASVRSTKRKAPVEEPPADEVVDEANAEAGQEDELVTEDKKPPARTRQRKATAKETAEGAKKPAAKRTRAQPVESDPAPEAPVTKTRGRAKKATSTVITTVVDEQPSIDGPEVSQKQKPAAEAPKKTTTRTRAAAPKPTRATAATRSTATKKKVQFQDDQDKENIPVETEAPKKSALKATGMRAKPTRKATGARTTRSRKAVSDEKTEVSPAKRTSMPLSPKKISQVAKTPTSSEDELAGPGSPLKMLNKSPMKSPVKGFLSPTKTSVNSPRHVMPQHSAASSPVAVRHASVLASPAKRPPQSPLKDGLKSAAKKFEHDASTARSVFSISQSASPTKTSLLQGSPKKVKIASLQQAPELTTKSSFKRSLLQSPARRPFTSPSKSLNASPRKDLPTPSVAMAKVSEEVQAPVVFSAASEVEGDDEKLDQAASKPQAIEIEETAVASPSPPLVAEQTQRSVFSEEVPTVPTFSMDYRRISLDSQLSEDELCSPDKRFAPTPLRKVAVTFTPNDTPIGLQEQSSLTPLADKLNGWAATSPEKQKPSRQQRGIFSLAPRTLHEEQADAELAACAQETSKSSFFEDDMAILGAEQPTPDRPSLALEAAHDALEVSMSSAASEEYGDENAIPPEAQALRAEQEADDPTLTCTPAKVFTPVAKISQLPREVYTVSKVPLRPSAEDSPLKLPRQRSKSLGGALSVLVDDAQDENSMPERPQTPVLSAVIDATTPSSGMQLDAETPGRTGRKRGSSSVLRGAVVFVDVHTSEGADASGIFVDLLTQMGARCVKHWNWNPRASTGESLDQTVSPQGQSPQTPAAGKVGITHVVYKDGGVRTLQKVRLAHGLVCCVGVGWVLDCEREDRWLEESQYALDTSHVPRGGSRRRKSMEPRALANLGGTLVPATHETPGKATMSPTKEFLTFNTPAARRDSFELNAHQVTPEEAEVLSTHVPFSPATPTSAKAGTPDAPGLIDASPTTPFYLSKGAELVQRTCPPKQTGELLFPVSGNVEDEPDETVRNRLLAARRKTLQWSSKTQSPLGRTVSYGR